MKRTHDQQKGMGLILEIQEISWGLVVLDPHLVDVI